MKWTKMMMFRGAQSHRHELPLVPVRDVEAAYPREKRSGKDSIARTGHPEFEWSALGDSKGAGSGCGSDFKSIATTGAACRSKLIPPYRMAATDRRLSALCREPPGMKA